MDDDWGELFQEELVPRRPVVNDNEGNGAGNDDPGNDAVAAEWEEVFQEDIPAFGMRETASASTATAASATSVDNVFSVEGAAVPERSYLKRHWRGKGGGRPQGSRLVRELAARNAEEGAGPEDEVPCPGSIEYARQCRLQKREAQSAQLRRPGFQDMSPREACLNVVGRPEIVASLGTKLHQDLRLVSQNMLGKDMATDTFLEHQFSTPSGTVSYRQLDSFVQKCNSHVRTLSVAAAMLEAANFLWGVFMAMLCFLFTTTDSVVEPLCMITKIRYDETPTKARVKDISEGLPNPGSGALVPQPQASFAQRSSHLSRMCNILLITVLSNHT